VKKPERRQYLKNAYRVLLTRARQGMVIFVPPGAKRDKTRSPGHTHVKELAMSSHLVKAQYDKSKSQQRERSRTVRPAQYRRASQAGQDHQNPDDDVEHRDRSPIDTRTIRQHPLHEAALRR
jgi:hypothetical protein